MSKTTNDLGQKTLAVNMASLSPVIKKDEVIINVLSVCYMLILQTFFLSRIF